MELRFINEKIGSGLFTSQFIPKGTIVFFQDPLDQVITPQRFNALPIVYQALVDQYGYLDRHGNWVLGWDQSIYTNHNCNPNALDTAFGFEIAIRDIHPGEELTIDYALLNLTEAIPVSCGCVNCRKVLHPDDFDHFADLWDAEIKDALQSCRAVPQPLWSYFTPELIQTLEAVLNGQQPYPSVRQMQYHPKTS
jgi:uncharacterized protein